MRKFIYVIMLAGIMISCGSNENQENTNASETSYEDALARMNQSFNTIVVEEAIQTDNYTYIRYHQDGNEYWGAISRRPIEEGKTYYYQDAMEMKNFQSKSLDRVFPSIWFINNFSDNPPEKVVKNASKSDDLAQGHTAAKDMHQNIQVEKADGGKTLAEIFEMKSDLEGQEVMVKGQVVKLNLNIMNKNWIHIQDGTSFNDLFDLTITTTDAINFKEGDIVAFKGKLKLNQDFGYGYQYDFLLEDAKIQE